MMPGKSDDFPGSFCLNVQDTEWEKTDVIRDLFLGIALNMDLSEDAERYFRTHLSLTVYDLPAPPSFFT